MSLPQASISEFLTLAESVQALKFGSFAQKSGRKSPYFFNSAAFSSGAALDRIGSFLAELIRDIPCDCLFGPAYKGVSLATAAAIASARLGRDLPVVLNRKEAKEHGEGGVFTGATEALKRRGVRIVIIDDVQIYVSQ
jgi:orotate phosphoribosyltransferase